MRSEELRRRLEALNGGPLESAPPPDEAAGPPRPRAARRKPPPIAPASAAALDALLGGEARETDAGSYYHVERALTDCAPDVGGLGRRVADALCCDGFRAALPRGARVEAPHEVVFLDLETLGLRDAPLFLIGALTVRPDGAATARQLLARSRDEEAAVLSAWAAELRSARLLVTYNGATFDMPYLRKRAAAHGMHGVRLGRRAGHLDLLKVARARYRGRLPNCRLQTLERHLCGRTREGDVPGRRIPAVYDRFTRTGDATELAAVLRHNLLDLATTADLLALFWAPGG